MATNLSGKKKALFICGSNNQTTMMHEISGHLDDFDCYFTPYYCDGFLKILYNAGLLDFSVAGKRFQDEAVLYILTKGLKLDFEGRNNDYDIIIICSDLVVQKNIRSKKIVLVQEGMTDPENFIYHLVRTLRMPRYLASTATTGLSHRYDAFCVASAGYRDHFASKGVNPDKVIVTGIPNFDNVSKFLNNTFPHNDFVLAATSDARETYKPENRKKFIYKCLDIADGRQIIFKLHPNENFKRGVREIIRYAPGSIIYTAGNVNHMVANCRVLITKYSSVVYVGLSLGKEVYSDFKVDRLRELTPVQNGGTSGKNISFVCRALAEGNKICPDEVQDRFNQDAENYDYSKLSDSLIGA